MMLSRFFANPIAAATALIIVGFFGREIGAMVFDILNGLLFSLAVFSALLGGA